MSSHLRTTVTLFPFSVSSIHICIPLSVAFHVHNGLLRGLVGDFTFWTSDSSSSEDLWVFRKVAPPPLALFRVGSFQIRFGFEGGVVVANYSLIQWFSFGRVRRLRVVLLMAAPLVLHVLLAKSMASGVVVLVFCLFQAWLGWPWTMVRQCFWWLCYGFVWILRWRFFGCAMVWFWWLGQ
jgi:hypothetical protein